VKLGVVEVKNSLDKEALEAEIARMQSEGYYPIVIVEMLSLEEELEKKRLSGAGRSFL
jgi:hypothetical protein